MKIAELRKKLKTIDEKLWVEVENGPIDKPDFYMQWNELFPGLKINYGENFVMELNPSKNSKLSSFYLDGPDCLEMSPKFAFDFGERYGKVLKLGGQFLLENATLQSYKCLLQETIVEGLQNELDQVSNDDKGWFGIRQNDKTGIFQVLYWNNFIATIDVHLPIESMNPISVELKLNDLGLKPDVLLDVGQRAELFAGLELLKRFVARVNKRMEWQK